MQGRRVGTLTLGIILIIIGIAYLLSNIYNLEISFQILKWWPITFIMIGIEVLIYNHKALKENCSIRFDGISLFLIVLILFFSFSACVFSKISTEILNPNSPIYYQKYLNCI
jgi:hypothetical protein